MYQNFIEIHKNPLTITITLNIHNVFTDLFEFIS